MRHRFGRLALAALALGASGCDYYYNDIPSPDNLMHLVPWFDGMRVQPAVYPYQRADVPRNAVRGTVPLGGGEADWLAEWSVGNTTTADRLTNPLAGVPTTLRGDTLYQTHCAVCHGQAGAGDGPVGPKVAARSLLTDIARGFTDGYLYSIVRYGRGVMPRYGDKLRVRDRWEIVNFVRQLQQPAPEPAAAPGGLR